MENLLTLKEAQQRLTVSASMMNRLVHAKGFPSLKIGRHWRIEPVQLRAWLAEQMQAKDDSCLI